MAVVAVGTAAVVAAGTTTKKIIDILIAVDIACSSARN